MRWIPLLVFAIGCGGSGTDDATFVAWGSSTSSITLAWQPVDGATGYQLDRDGREPVMLGADDLQYLDSGLAEGSYTYHLTALGATAPVENAKGKTSEHAAIITADDPPLGDPVVGTGMLELPVARASVADGTTLTLQAITPPTEGDVAIAVSSDTAPTAPVDIAFALDDDDLASLSNVGVAAKQPDGTWVGVAARLEGDRAVVTVAPEARHAFAGPAAWQWRFVKFRRIRIDPVPVLVRASTEAVVVAKAVFSDDICQTGSAIWMCESRNDALIPLRAPIVLAFPVMNRVGTWKLDGPGTLDADPDEHFATYTAPSSRPAQNVWAITFDMDTAPFLAVTQVRWLSDHYKLTLDYYNEANVLATAYDGAVTDEIWFGIDASATAITVTDGPYNTDSKVENQFCTQPGFKVTETSPFELFTANRIQIGGANGEIAIMLDGSSHDAGIILTLPDGSTQMIPSVTTSETLNLLIPNVHLERITGEKTFEVPGTKWLLKVSPISTL